MVIIILITNIMIENGFHAVCFTKLSHWGGQWVQLTKKDLVSVAIFLSVMFSFWDSTIARLLQMQFRRKFKRQGTEDILGNMDHDSLSAYDYNNPLKRTVYDASDFGPKRFGKGYYADRKLEEVEDLLRNEQERRRRWP